MQSSDEDGDVIFINMNQEPPFETYDDPRELNSFTPRPTFVKVIERVIDDLSAETAPANSASHVSGVRTDDGDRQNAVIQARTPGFIVKLDQDAFVSLPVKLANPLDIPIYARGSPFPNRYTDILPTPNTLIELQLLNSRLTGTLINTDEYDIILCLGPLGNLMLFSKV